MKIIAISLLLSIFFTPIVADETVAHQKDIRVFENILATALDMDSPNREFPAFENQNAVKATYLKNQGLLIEINSLLASNIPRHFRTFHMDLPDFPRDIEVPRLPLSPDLNEKMEELIERSREKMELELDAQEEEQEWIEKEQEYIEKDLNEELEKARQLRQESLARLKAELRALEGRAKVKEMNEKLIKEELLASQAAHKEALETFNKQIKGFRKQHSENWAEESEKIKDTIIDALCQYGATIRTVQPNEYFTLILKRFEPNEGGDRLDRIYVFPKQSVIDCRDGKITQKELITIADSYTSN